MGMTEYGIVGHLNLKWYVIKIIFSGGFIFFVYLYFIMIVNTPYIECYVKKSFLKGERNYKSNDEMVFGILVGIRFIFNRNPLFIVYLPSIGAVYDKVDQNAIFNKEKLNYEGEIHLNDIAWWDSISSHWQLIQLKFFKLSEVEMVSRTNQFRKGKYLFTCDPYPDPEYNDYSQSEIWHEHKTKTFFFDNETGVLCCTPNNKMRIWNSSLSPNEKDDGKWLRVYRDNYNNISSEDNKFMGGEEDFLY